MILAFLVRFSLQAIEDFPCDIVAYARGTTNPVTSLSFGASYSIQLNTCLEERSYTVIDTGYLYKRSVQPILSNFSSFTEVSIADPLSPVTLDWQESGFIVKFPRRYTGVNISLTVVDWKTFYANHPYQVQEMQYGSIPLRRPFRNMVY